MVLFLEKDLNQKGNNRSMQLAAWPMCIDCKACRPLMVETAKTFE